MNTELGENTKLSISNKKNWFRSALLKIKFLCQFFRLEGDIYYSHCPFGVFFFFLILIPSIITLPDKLFLITHRDFPNKEIISWS